MSDKTYFRNCFERRVDPEGTLTPAERYRKAERLRRAHLFRVRYAPNPTRRPHPHRTGGGPEVA